jgi:PAS domain S-box-containing protein
VRGRQATEAAAQRLRLLTDALPVLIGYLDRERRYQFANHAYRAWFNQDPASLLGRPVREVVGEKAYAAAEGYMDRALAGERLTFEAAMPYREGFLKYIRTDYIPDVRNGEVQGFYSLVTDMTEQAEARQQVQELNEELAAMNEEMLVANEELRETNNRLIHTNVDLDTFVYTASHDLKAPISNIEGLLYLLRAELPAEVLASEYVGPTLGLMQDSVERFKRTIAHLTDVSKLQKEHDAPATSVDLAAVVEDVSRDLAPLVQETEGKLFVNVPPHVRVRFSEKNLRSVVYNLLSNALKYRSPDRPPRVDVRTHARPGFTVLEVHDNGLGIDQNHQPRLFNMFQRFHDHVEGSGIGLYMVKRVVENAGGSLEVHSQPGAGSTFFVHLPQAENGQN